MLNVCRKGYNERSAFTFLTFHLQTSPVSFGDNVITQTQPQTRSLAGGLGGEKGLKNLGFDRRRGYPSRYRSPGFRYAH